MMKLGAPRLRDNVKSSNKVYNKCVHLVSIGLMAFSLLFWMYLYFANGDFIIYNPASLLPKFEHLVNQAPAQYRAVILAGPHKTGSSSIQSNIYSWSKAGSLGHDWTWVTPNMTCVHEHSAACRNQRWLSLPDQIHKVWNCAGMCLYRETYRKIPYLCSKLMTCYSSALEENVVAKKKCCLWLRKVCE
jgi:hypothetical protein